MTNVGDLWLHNGERRAVLSVVTSGVFFVSDVPVVEILGYDTTLEWNDWVRRAELLEPEPPKPIDRPDDVQCPACALTVHTGDLADDDHVRCRCGALFSVTIVAYAISEHLLEDPDD